MKNKSAVALSAVALLAACGLRDWTPPPESLVATTKRFEFHSNFWLNLNHYLYKMASGEGRSPIEPGQLALVESLSPEDRRVWDDAVGYYAAHHVANNIRTDDSLFAFKRWVLELPRDTVLQSADFDPEWLDLLNRVAPIYQRDFWPIHDGANRTTLDDWLPLIQETEDPVFERLARLGRNDWPEEPIRVDLSYYSNWAGAYTTNQPVTQVVISSVDIQPPPNWLELLFHEASHAIIGSWSPLGQAIDSAAARHGVEPPRQLWHAMLFYFSGRVLQDELSTLGMGHQLYMVDKDVFGSLHPLLFRYVEPYVAGDATLDESLDRLMQAVASETG